MTGNLSRLSLYKKKVQFWTWLKTQTHAEVCECVILIGGFQTISYLAGYIKINTLYLGVISHRT